MKRSMFSNSSLILPLQLKLFRIIINAFDLYKHEKILDLHKYINNQLNNDIISLQVKNEIQVNQTIKFQSQLEKGKWPFSTAPFGYVKNANTFKITENRDSSKVFEIFCLSSEGYGPTQIARIMNDKYDNSQFHDQKIDGIIKNRFYTGELKFQGKTYKGDFNPIISKELFQAAQKPKQKRIPSANLVQLPLTKTIKSKDQNGGHDYFFVGYVKQKKYSLHFYYKDQNRNISAISLHTRFSDLIYNVDPQNLTEILLLIHKDIIEPNISGFIKSAKISIGFIEASDEVDWVDKDIFTKRQEIELWKFFLSQDNFVKYGIEIIRLFKFWNILDYTSRIELQRIAFPQGVYIEHNSDKLYPASPSCLNAN